MGTSLDSLVREIKISIKRIGLFKEWIGQQEGSTREVYSRQESDFRSNYGFGVSFYALGRLKRWGMM